MDRATSPQNRATANDQLEKVEEASTDCDSTIDLNSKCVKVLDKQIKARGKQNKNTRESISQDCKQVQVDKLQRGLKEVTMICILEGLQDQENLRIVDALLKKLGRAKATLTFPSRGHALAPPHLASQYLASCREGPVLKALERESEGDMDETMKCEVSGQIKAMKSIKQERH